MANATHVRLAATATRLIAAHGRAVTLVKPSTTLVDVDNPQDGVDPAGATTVSSTAAFFADTTFDSGGTMVHRRGVELVLLDAVGGVDLAGFDFLKDGTKPRKIIRRLKIAPGDTTIAWMLEVQL